MITVRTIVLLLGLAGGFGALDALARPPATKIPDGTTGTMTDEELGRLLTGLGLDPEPYEIGDAGLRGFTVTFAHGDWQIVINIGLSRDRTVVWLFAPLSRVGDVHELSPVALLALLARNGTMDLAYFSYDAESGTLYLELPVPVGMATPGIVKARIEALADLIKGTVELWDIRYWRKK